jgi:oligopeptide transport system substrate-binding protein
MKKILCTALVILAAVLCAGSASSAPKVLNYANGGAPDVLEPVMNNYLKTSYIMYNIYCGLSRTGKDGIAELAYAESYEVSDDSLTYTFKLRPNSKFSDGSPLTAHDWEVSFKHKIAPETASPGGDLYMFVKGAEAYNQGTGSADDVGIKALDDNTLRITFENPTPFFLDLVARYIPYKMDVLKSDPNWFKNPETYISNGAFRVKSVDPQVGFVLEKNPYYYDAENVHIDEINYNFIDDMSVALEAYRSGALHMNDDLNAEAIKLYKDTPELQSFPRINTSYISIHTGNLPDARVRKALSLAMNRPVIINDILGQTYTPAEGLVPYGIHWGDKEFREVAGSLIKTDIDEAKKLLAEAGYPNGEGLKTVRIITINNQEDIDTAQAWQSMWKQIGVNSEITVYERSVYWDVLYTNDWEVARDGWTGDYDNPKTNMYLWMAYKQGPDTDVRWYDTPNAKKYDELMRAADKETDTEKQLQIYMEAERVILDDMPVIPVWHGDETILVKPEVTGVVKNNIGYISFNFADIKTD